MVAYERLSKQGVLRWDEAQHRALETLNTLHAKLVGDMDGGAAKAKAKSEAPKKEGSWFSDLFTAREEDEAAAYTSHGGVYLFGGPGCGKTFCMDLFYASLPGTDGKEKRREHFHSFMLHTHQTLHKLGKAGHTEDTVAIYAQRVAAKTRVLCLDEFQVTDVADAMIIRRLMDQLWERGVTVVTTSNREPDELYKNGLNRVQFVPCIEAIKARCVVHPMESVRDYRLTGRGIGGEDSGMDRAAAADSKVRGGFVWRGSRTRKVRRGSSGGFVGSPTRRSSSGWRWPWGDGGSRSPGRAAASLCSVSRSSARAPWARGITPPSPPRFTPWAYPGSLG